MTADEISFAGGTLVATLSTPYVWYYTNSSGNSITGLNKWQLLSPFRWYSYHSTESVINDSNSPGFFGSDFVNSIGIVRPVISISKCAKVKSGNGTPESPYEIDENSCS